MLLYKDVVYCYLKYSAQFWSKVLSRIGVCQTGATGIIKSLKQLLGKELLNLLSSAGRNVRHLAWKGPRRGKLYKSPKFCVAWKSGLSWLLVASSPTRSTGHCVKLVEGFQLNTGGSSSLEDCRTFHVVQCI